MRTPSKHGSRPALAAAAFCAAVLCGGAVSALEEAAPPPAAPPAAVAPRPRPPVRVGTLSNGLRLLCRANDASEMVSIVCMVRAGIPDERDDQSGLAALTAEALVRGTTTHTDRGFQEMLLAAGGNIRAAPAFDFTEITLVTNKDLFERALKVLGDVVSHPRFSAEDVTAAKETLKRRITGQQQDMISGAYQALLGQLYSRSPYGRPANGDPEVIDRLRPEDVRRFWDANYVQNRITVAVVGDVDASKALTLALKAFQDVPFRPGSVTPAPPPEQLRRPRVEFVRGAEPRAQIMVGFLTPPATRANFPVYAVLDAVVGGGKRARLFRNIREGKSLGYELGSFYQPLMYQSHLTGYVVTDQYRKVPRGEGVESLIDKVKELLIEQYRQLAAAGPTDQEIARARAYVMGRYALQRQERTRDQAKWLAWNSAMRLGTDFDEYFAAKVPAVTKEQVQAAAKECFNSYALVVTVPQDQQ